MSFQGKRIRKAYKAIDQSKILTSEEAVKLIKQVSTAKFDETVELVMNLNVDTRKADQTIRGVVDLPHGNGKKVRVAVFARDAKAKEALDAGADIVGAEDLVEIIQKGQIDFDRCIATPDMMIVVGRLGKILGTKGLMPNPKLGTVTLNVADAVKSIKLGQIEYRAEKAGVVHAGVGKVSFNDQALVENIKKLATTLVKTRPASVKGVYVKSAYLSSTMGPAVQLNVEEFYL